MRRPCPTGSRSGLKLERTPRNAVSGELPCFIMPVGMPTVMWENGIAFLTVEITYQLTAALEG